MGTRLLLVVPLLAGCSLIDALGDTRSPTADDGGTTGDGAKTAWVRKQDMLSPRSGAHFAAKDGMIYAVAGGAGTANDIYNPAANTWAMRMSLSPPGRDRGGAATVDGHVYMIGGIINASSCTSRVDRYDAGGNQWEARATADIGICRFGMAAIGTKIYVLAGRTRNGGTVLANVDIYDPSTKQWTTGPSLPRPLYNGLGAAVANGTIYFGGLADASTDTTELYAFTPE